LHWSTPVLGDVGEPSALTLQEELDKEALELEACWCAASVPAPIECREKREAGPMLTAEALSTASNSFSPNTSLAGDGFVAGSRGQVRLEGLYHMQAGRRSQTAATTMIIGGSTNTVIMDDPALPQGAAPRCARQARATSQQWRRCTLQSASSVAFAAASP
jgi:hypothetical protein